MSVDTWDFTPYLIIRFSCWALVWCASLADFIRYKGEKVHGWQLHRSVFGVLCAMVAKETVTLAWRLGGEDKSNFYYVLIFFYDLADASFLCLLMVISWGWQITRQTIGEGKVPIIVAPLVNFVSIVIHDFIFEKEGGHNGACYIRVTHWEANLLLVATLSYLFTIIYMWLWIFQTLKIEKARLELQIAAGIGTNSPGVDDDTPRPPPNLATQHGNAVAFIQDPTFGGPAPEAQSQAVGSSIVTGDHEEGELPIRVTDEGIYDTDDDTTMPMQAKLRLLGRFFEAVSLFFAANFTVIVFNVWTARCEQLDQQGPPRREVTITRIVLLVLRDIVYFLFVSALVYIFRLRQSNPYYMVGDYIIDDDEGGQGATQMRQVPDTPDTHP
eukprot:comp21947_c0_seq1/m.31634 comp21947_c0_seq1/g.31634  ORF comp21947_c0_seq1/g.31634 comp21947_c0_seq1/m.31634 type:complete len:384 (-) comp21947_c0_seq1:134-1285(-)